MTEKERTYIAIDLKSFYASVECKERNRDPLTTNLVVADKSRTEKTICLAVSPALKCYGIPGRARLFEPRFLRPGEGGPQFPDRTGRQLENRRFPHGRKTNPPASRTCRRMKKQSGKFPVLRGAFYCLAGPSMIALWLMFQPPPRAVYRETSVLACW